MFCGYSRVRPNLEHEGSVVPTSIYQKGIYFDIIYNHKFTISVINIYYIGV